MWLVESEFRPSVALVLYEGEEEVLLAFRFDQEGNPTSLFAPDRDLLERLLGRGMRYLHPRVVAAGTGVAWWRPAWPAPMHFSLPALADLSGQVFPQPPLLSPPPGEKLLVYALPEDRRPTPDTPLLLAPYPNLFPDGAVCWGSTRLPGGEDPEAWEAAFFEGAFSHAGSLRPLKRGSLTDLWRKLAGKRRFPVGRLKAAGLTLGELLGRWR